MSEIVNGRNQESLTEIVDKKTTELLKELSGGQVVHSQKLIDNLIVVSSAAGGAGASTIVANLAYTIKQMGFSVLVVDMNVSYPIQHSYFGIKQELKKKDLTTFILGKNNIGESIETARDISVLMANNRNLIDYINCDNASSASNLDDAIERVRPMFDVILVDCPMAIDYDPVNTMLYKADALYLVWDENIGCVSNTERIRRNLVLTGIEAHNKVRLIFNKRTSIHYPEDIIEKFNLELVANLPFELAVIETALQGKIFCEKGASASKNAAYYVKEIKNLAHKMLEIGGLRS